MGGRPYGEAEAGHRNITRGMTMVEEERGRWGYEKQVRRNGDRGERRGDVQGGSATKSKGWSSGSKGDSAEETEEDETTEWEQGESRDTLMASPWGTQESGAGGLQVGAQAGGSDGRKTPSAAADEAVRRGRHGARQGHKK